MSKPLYVACRSTGVRSRGSRTPVRPRGFTTFPHRVPPTTVRPRGSSLPDVEFVASVQVRDGTGWAFENVNAVEERWNSVHEPCVRTLWRNLVNRCQRTFVREPRERTLVAP